MNDKQNARILDQTPKSNKIKIQQDSHTQVISDNLFSNTLLYPTSTKRILIMEPITPIENNENEWHTLFNNVQNKTSPYCTKYISRTRTKETWTEGGCEN